MCWLRYPQYWLSCICCSYSYIFPLHVPREWMKFYQNWLHNNRETCLCVSADLQVEVDYIVLVEEGDSLQDLPHEPLHVFLTEGLVLPIWHALVEDLTSSRTERRHKHTQTSEYNVKQTEYMFTCPFETFQCKSIAYQSSMAKIYFLCLTCAGSGGLQPNPACTRKPNYSPCSPFHLQPHQNDYETCPMSGFLWTIPPDSMEINHYPPPKCKSVCLLRLAGGGGRNSRALQM